MNKHFGDVNGIVAPVGAGCLYGLTDGKDPRPLLDFYANKINHTRVFAGKLTPNDTRTGQSIEAVYNRLPDFLEWHQERDLRTEVTCCTDTGADGGYNEENHVSEVASICQHYRRTVIGVEIWNEWKHPSQRPISIEELRSLGEVAKDEYDGPIALGAVEGLDELDVNTGEYPTAYTGFNSYANVHLNRDKKPSYREAFRIKELIHIRDKYNCGGCNNEPGRFDHESLDGEWDGLGHERFAYILGALGVAWNFMSIAHGTNMRDVNLLSGVELSAFNAYLRGASKVKRGRYDWFNANNQGAWPQSPVKSGAFMEGEANSPDRALWRAYSYLGVDNIVIAGGTDTSKFNLEYQNNWQPIEIVDEFASTQIIRIEQR